MGLAQVVQDADKDIQEVYKGSYRFITGKKTFSDEKFTLYKDFETNDLIFEAEIVSRVANGEFLKLNVLYTVNSKYEPLQVIIEKSLGDQFARETFTPEKNMPQLVYEFTDGEDTKEVRIQTPAKYQIATPATCTSMLLTISKKYDPTILNSFYIISSENNWEYTKAAQSKNVYFKCDNIHVQEEMTVGKKTLSGLKFEVFLDDKKRDEKIMYFLSKHHAIPYHVKIDRETHVDIKNLQDLSPNRMEDFLK